MSPIRLGVMTRIGGVRTDGVRTAGDRLRDGTGHDAGRPAPGPPRQCGHCLERGPQRRRAGVPLRHNERAAPQRSRRWETAGRWRTYRWRPTVCSVSPGAAPGSSRSGARALSPRSCTATMGHDAGRGRWRCLSLGGVWGASGVAKFATRVALSLVVFGVFLSGCAHLTMRAPNVDSQRGELSVVNCTESLSAVWSDAVLATLNIGHGVAALAWEDYRKILDAGPISSSATAMASFAAAMPLMSSAVGGLIKASDCTLARDHAYENRRLSVDDNQQITRRTEKGSVMRAISPDGVEREFVVPTLQGTKIDIPERFSLPVRTGDQ